MSIGLPFERLLITFGGPEIWKKAFCWYNNTFLERLLAFYCHLKWIKFSTVCLTKQYQIMCNNNYFIVETLYVPVKKAKWHWQIDFTWYEHLSHFNIQESIFHTAENTFSNRGLLKKVVWRRVKYRYRNSILFASNLKQITPFFLMIWGVLWFGECIDIWIAASVVCNLAFSSSKVLKIFLFS